MTDTAEAGSARQLFWRALAAALALAAAICLVMWGASSNPAPAAGSGEPPTSSSTATATGVVEATTASTVVPSPTRPLALRIPAIGVKAHIIRLGQRQDGTVEVPQNPDQVGWFRLGPPPGAAGSSVILGHVDSMSGPAVFYRLKELQPGDLIAVRLDDGSTARFRVRTIQTYANADFPAKKVYGRQGLSRLNLVTCGGEYDSSRGGYQSNVVVYSRRVA